MSARNILICVAIILSVVLLTSCLTLVWVSNSLEKSVKEKTCSDFSTYEQAESVFASDPVKYKGLDRDGDGRACSDLSN